MRSDVPSLEAEVNAPLADVPSVAAAAGGDLERVSASPTEPAEEPARETRRPRRTREDKPRATTAAEQAWGQPAGTMRFAPPPGPTVAAQRKPEGAEGAPAEPSAAPEGASAGEESPAAPPPGTTGGEDT
jgi:ribonuclease E